MSRSREKDKKHGKKQRKAQGRLALVIRRRAAGQNLEPSFISKHEDQEADAKKVFIELRKKIQ